MSLVEAQKDSAFSFLLCNVVCRLPTTADSSGNLVLGDKVSLPRSHRLSYHVDCCTFCFFPLFTFISFWAIIFFLKAILVSHKNATILPNRLWLVFHHFFFITHVTWVVMTKIMIFLFIYIVLEFLIIFQHSCNLLKW